MSEFRNERAAGVTGTAPTVAVWDLGVRGFHWALVLCVAVSAYSGFFGPANWLNIHLIFGIGIAALVAFRLIWGWSGSGYARFRGFAPSRDSIRAHIAAIRAGARIRHLGHNPLGAAMVFALLAVLAAIVLSGTLALGGVVKQGPLAFAIDYSSGMLLRRGHKLLALLLVLMIAAHLGGVLFESVWTRENLARAMLTGRKRAAPGSRPPGGTARPWLAAAAMAAVAAVAIPGTLLLSAVPAAGVPPAALDASYARECGACHLAYSPSLAPAATWAAVMAGLDRHFGENASLDTATTAKLADWLARSSSEHWDTRAANLLRVPDPAAPLRITAAPGWKRVHRRLPDAVFAAHSVGAKGACAACHQDAASGRFDPQRISIPEDAEP